MPIFLDTLIGILAFIGTLLFHVAWWNVRKPKAEIQGLLISFIGIPLLLVVVFMLVCRVLGMAIWPFIDMALAGLLYLSLATAYLQTYPALTCEIPTFRILNAIARSGTKGLQKEEITGIFNDEELLESRKLLLSADRLADSQNGSTRLTLAGRWLARLFIAYRGLLGLDFGKG